MRFAWVHSHSPEGLVGVQSGVGLPPREGWAYLYPVSGIDSFSLIQLHENNYEAAQALQALVKKPYPKELKTKWSDDDTVSGCGVRQAIPHHMNTRTVIDDDDEEEEEEDGGGGGGGDDDDGGGGGGGGDDDGDDVDDDDNDDDVRMLMTMTMMMVVVIVGQ